MIAKPEYHLDSQTADKVRGFFASLKHVKGPKAGQPFDLEPWQQDIVVPLLAEKRSDGTRRYRVAYIEVPRGNGKSTLMAGVCLYLLFCDGEQGAEVYSVAADRDQATLVFDPACAMIRRSWLNDYAKIRDSYKRVIYEQNNSFYRAIASDVGGSHGYNAHGVVFDEFHVQPNRALYDVMMTSTGKRSQPLTVLVTTAGFDRSSICYETHCYAKQVISGEIDDPSFMGVIHSADPDDDWEDEATWAKANPNLGVSVPIEYLREQSRRAKQSPAYSNTFCRLHLNIWTEQDVRIIPMHAWDSCDDAVDAESLKGEVCFAGLDLASTRDVTALVLVFPREGGRFEVLPWFWIPEENIDDRARQDRRQVLAFAANKHIETTGGNEVDSEYLVSRILDICSDYDVREVAFDSWNATTIMQMLVNGGLPEDKRVKFPQGFATYTEPFKKLLSLLAAGKLSHAGNPVLRWMASNTGHREDPSGNIRPDKSRSNNQKIDGICAMLMGLGRALQAEVPVEGGLLVL